jgi:membrane protease YdiL (CAAX protease family)
MDYWSYQSYFEEKDRERRLVRPLRQNSNAVFFGLALVVLLGLFLNYPLQAGARELVSRLAPDSAGLASALRMLSDLIIAALMLLIPMTIIRLWVDIPLWAAFPLRTPKAEILSPAILACLGASAVGSLSYGLISLLLDALFGVELGAPVYAAPIGAPSTVLYLVRIVLLPSILEELFFRGVIMQSLRRFGDGFALVCSSVVFGLAHLNAPQGVSAFFIALAIGFFVLRTGSILTGVIIHFVNNALVVAAEFITRGMNPGALDMFNRLQFAIYVFLGFVGLVWLLVSHNGRTIGLAPSRWPLSNGKKARVFFISPASIAYYVVLAAYAVINIVWG